MKKIQLVIIEWIDAAIHARDSFDRKEASKLGLVEGISVGILVHEDKKQITVAADYFHIDDQFRCLGSYPKSGIKKITRKYINWK